MSMILASEPLPRERMVSSYRSSGRSCPPVQRVARKARTQEGVQGVRRTEVCRLSDDLEIASTKPGIIWGLPFENVNNRRNAEQSLLESEECLRLLIENLREYAIFQLDPKGHIVSWNAGAERMKGYRADEVLGKYISIFYDQSDAQNRKPEHNLMSAAQAGECKDEGWRIRKDGSRFWASVVIAALRDAEGSLRGFIKITRDMTEGRSREAILREAKEELERRVQRRAAALVQMNLEYRQEIAERKRVEGELRKSLGQVRALAARLQLVREEERARVAREMHDELGQACTAIKMDIASIGRKTNKTQIQLRTKAHAAMELVDRMVVTI